MESAGLKKYRQDIDVIKGLAILAVILYHMGFCSAGYLGVDVFLVVNGFLVIPSIFKQVSEGKFRGIDFLKRKIARTYPLLVVVCTVSLFIGYFVMFPDGLNTLSESVITTLTYSNNFLSFYLTRDYWDWTNEFKPLMHTWYLGVLFQIYFFFCITAYIINKKSKNKKKAFQYAMYIAGGISFILFLIPSIYKNIKFYFFPFRIFEFCAGGIVGLYGEKILNIIEIKWGKLFCKGIYLIGICGVCAVLYNNLVTGAIYVLTLAVIITCFCILFGGTEIRYPLFITPIIYVGKMSYSFFLWHQVILAFFRLCFSTEFTVYNSFIYWVILILLALFSYYGVEQKRYQSGVYKKFIVIAGTVMMFSFIIWTRAGIVRDIPELEISKNNIERRKFPQYVDRIYDYDHDFLKPDTNKVKVLLVGNSYARDFANILLESTMCEKIEISYMPGISGEYSEETVHRVSQSDYIFISGEKELVPDYFWEAVPAPKNVYGIGTKNFGNCNEIIYNKRFWGEKIHDWTAIVQQSFEEEESLLHDQWGDQYISLLSYVRNADETVRIFTNDNKFISYDCYHLTPAGARYYAEQIDWKNIFSFSLENS